MFRQTSPQQLNPATAYHRNLAPDDYDTCSRSHYFCHVARQLDTLLEELADLYRTRAQMETASEISEVYKGAMDGRILCKEGEVARADAELRRIGEILLG